jgi:hypothetical protein
MLPHILVDTLARLRRVLTNDTAFIGSKVPERLWDRVV